MKSSPPGRPSSVLWRVCVCAGGLVALIGVLFYLLRPHARSTAPRSDSGTRRMVERLEKIARESDPLENVFLNHQRAELFRAKLAG